MPDIRKCCVPNCLSEAVNGRGFFGFPSNLDLRQKWIKALCLMRVTSGAKICPKYFQPQDVLDNYITEV